MQVIRYETFCRNRPNHWATLAVVERHDPEDPNFDPERPLHVHALTISQPRRGGWNTANPRFWDMEGNHPNILQKELRDGPGGNPARDAFHYLWKAVGEEGEEVEDLMAGAPARRFPPRPAFFVLRFVRHVSHIQEPSGTTVRPTHARWN